MNTKLYVGNLSFNTSETELKGLFEQFGPVTEANLVMDRMSGRSRGFGFVTMATPEAAQAAIKGLNGQQVGGRAITVSEARPREEGGGGGGGGRGDRGDRGERPRGPRREHSH